MLQQVCSVILLQIIHLQLHMYLVEFPFIQIHCIIKYFELNTSVWGHIKTLDLSKREATEQIKHFTENVRG